ncbi:peptidoglycan D,D-transpeptidase FtsI family protein [Rhodoplanes roseus]|uniref:Penicillin-binding protein n=1 Tax=Rhodoplanes roseus TaxID=29409 RepID=A0A327KVE3_9BRAD|nr:penicillin-binding protein 2 [Rhodoplanes roseus]RAI41733.1 penicillin-binding protein [Rhodoplanes roseus]
MTSAPPPGPADAQLPVAVPDAPHVPWHRRLVQALLYDRKIDRSRKTRARIGLAVLVFGCIYGIIAGRLVLYAVAPETHANRRGGGSDAVATARPDILDRTGEILATDVRVPSLFAEPKRLIDADEAVELLTAVMPDLDTGELRDRLGSKKGFAWLKREITPKQQREVHRLGIPGLGFLNENKRIYPNGREVSHLIGHVNIDNQGIAGLEKYLDSRGLADLHRAGLASDRQQEPLQLAVDLRVQHAMHDELGRAREKFKAKAAAGVVLDVDTGEIVSMVSHPDYDPNNPKEALDPNRMNRLTTGVFEMGSVFKALTVGMTLDSGKMTLNSSVDARSALHWGKFKISDYHAQNRVLSVPEVFTYSSNVGAAKMALAVGVEGHKQYLRKIGQLDRLRTELPESAEPIVPKRWGELNTITISFGHGLSVAPLQALMGVAALMNGGYLIQPTFLKRSPQEARAVAKRVVKPETSVAMRYLMRLNSEKGSGKTAEVKGYYVGGKTGTAEKVVGGRYSKTKLLCDFIAVLPADKPRYVVLIMLDEPQPTPETHGFATAGWNAAPTAGKVIARIAPLLGLQPRFDLPPADQLILGRGKPAAAASDLTSSTTRREARATSGTTAAPPPTSLQPPSVRPPASVPAQGR